MRTSESVFHIVQYYETDSMKVVHHSNYVKWMEEARYHYLKKAGLDWDAMENGKGITMPVLFQSVEYKRLVRFGETIEIVCTCDRFNGIKMDFSYIFQSDSGKIIHARGVTKHGFINASYEPVSLREAYGEGYATLDRYANGANE